MITTAPAPSFAAVRAILSELSQSEQDAALAAWNTAPKQGSVPAQTIANFCRNFHNAQQTAKPSYFAPTVTPKPPVPAPVTPAETPKPTVPDYAAMRRAETACLTERDAISRTQRRSRALCAVIAATPERMHRWSANRPMPTMNEDYNR